YTVHHFGFAMHTGFGYAIVSWLPAFYLRWHGWTATEIGSAMGILLLTFGPLGAFSGGAAADGLIRRGIRDAHLRCGAAACALQAGAVAVAALADNVYVSLAGTAIAIAMMGFTAGPAGAALQTITPSSLRGQAGAFYTFVANLLGLS